MGLLRIDGGRVAQTGAGVTEVSGQLGREIGSMHQLLAQLQSGWRSTTAAPAFARTMNQYLAEAQTLQQALVSHGESLVRSAGVVGRTEDTLTIGGGR